MWFIVAQVFFFKDNNTTYICNINLMIDWRAVYFAILFWIAENYTYIALIITYMLYLIAGLRLYRMSHNIENE